MEEISKRDLEFMKEVAESYARRNPNGAFFKDYMELIARLDKRIHKYGEE